MNGSTAERERERARQGWLPGSTIVLTRAAGAPFGRLLATAGAVARARRHGVDIRLAILDRSPGFKRAALWLLAGGTLRFLDAEPGLARVGAGADVFLQTLEADDGATALEAMAAGLPVLLPPSDGAAALVTDGVQGWILRNPGSAREIAWRLRSFGDPGLRGAMAAQAKALAEHLRTVRSVA